MWHLENISIQKASRTLFYSNENRVEYDFQQKIDLFIHYENEYKFILERFMVLCFSDFDDKTTREQDILNFWKMPCAGEWKWPLCHWEKFKMIFIDVVKFVFVFYECVIGFIDNQLLQIVMQNKIGKPGVSCSTDI